MVDKPRPQQFLDVYNRFDAWLQAEFSRGEYREHTASLNTLLDSRRISKQDLQRLKAMAKLRNAMVHTASDGKTEHFIAEPTESAINEYRSLVHKVLNPPLAYDVAVKRPNIYATHFSSKVIDVIQAMNNHTYTHAPILDNDTVIGVFSENTVFSFIAAQRDVVHQETLILELNDFLPCDKHHSETFPFISRTTPLSDVQSLFLDNKQKGKRIGAVFITHSGKSTEKVLGMLTAWDIAGGETS